MLATVNDVRALDLRNQFKKVPDTFIKCTIEDEAVCHVNECVWGDKHVLGQALVAAHIVAVAQKGSSGPAGPVTGESAGGLSRTFGSTGGTESNSFWQSTHFGRRYLRLKATLPLTPIVANCVITSIPEC